MAFANALKKMAEPMVKPTPSSEKSAGSVDVLLGLTVGDSARHLLGVAHTCPAV